MNLILSSLKDNYKNGLKMLVNWHLKELSHRSRSLSSDHKKTLKGGERERQKANEGKKRRASGNKSLIYREWLWKSFFCFEKTIKESSPQPKMKIRAFDKTRGKENHFKICKKKNREQNVRRPLHLYKKRGRKCLLESITREKSFYEWTLNNIKLKQFKHETPELSRSTFLNKNRSQESSANLHKIVFPIDKSVEINNWSESPGESILSTAITKISSRKRNWRRCCNEYQSWNLFIVIKHPRGGIRGGKGSW